MNNGVSMSLTGSDWRVFARFFEGKGVKTPVTVIAAVTLLWSYDIDIFQHLIAAFGNAADSSIFGRIITGLLVAGGSGAIFNLFSKLGLRDPTQLRAKAQEARDEAEKRSKEAIAKTGNDNG